MSGITEVCAGETARAYDPGRVGIYTGGSALNWLLASVGIEPQPTSDVDGVFPRAAAARLLDTPGAQLYQEADYPEFTVRIPANPVTGLAAFDALGDDALYGSYERDSGRLRTVTAPNGMLVRCLDPASILFDTLRGRHNLARVEDTVIAAHRTGLLDAAGFAVVLDEYFRLLEVKVRNSHDQIAGSRRDHGLA